ncbi:electron transfer flavoprotein subunit alpha [Endozoicomonas sp. OPT23]|uniref:electron transfer flavoprotein subunit alpha n=1 Tax=Endozoicomonas sp. OPT23 TaxID=2072845 RepID=UPI00129AB089|nr:electron transfer flavoprotein subunit alpha/FixB family protein [Endozoicomonas sp. OPT23]MRI33160.1 electron transfer flavoprotein subunit alpha [Endozoicomonas sp. OPT23]
MTTVAHRRDPRTEWIIRNRLHPQHEALFASQNGPVRGPTGLIRKNPHNVGFIGPNGLKRIDRLEGNSSNVISINRQVRQVIEPEKPLHKVEQPDFHILVVPDLAGGRLTEQDKDVLGQAHTLANVEGSKGAVVAVIFGEHRETGLDQAGVDRLIHLEGSDYEDYCPELKLAALATIEQQLSPKHWLFPDSIHGGADLGSRLAATLGERPAVQAWQVNNQQATCRAASDSIDINRETPKILLLAEECADAVDETRHEVLPVTVDELIGTQTTLTDHGFMAVDPNSIPLAEAEFILAAGNGVSNWDLFHEAAEQLGATEGASRVAVDNGHMPRFRQVGATGTWVTASVYLAVGISGAIQHMQGIGQCQTVIAINTDANCDMVKRANLSVIGDSEEVLKELLLLIKEYREALSHAA